MDSLPRTSAVLRKRRENWKRKAAPCWKKAAEEKRRCQKRKQQDIVEIQKTIAAAVQAKEEEDRRIVELQEKKEALSADHKEFFREAGQLSDHISLMDKECFRLNSQKRKAGGDKRGTDLVSLGRVRSDTGPRKRVPDGGNSGAQ